ncbi:signal transduction histidine kinase [Roseinatronobacter thiooxidans]|uniref:histidine kinase n=1 Tax=Roseinatronobacter thiooxidans TaxID=121821 RepID=A0A2W7QM47_9RHOB|nr:HAMP domain-containing sensor histidine kinase [Roseinatronobacter thiooxidans]PZX39505.1 signal transduction histidine kinase [Roseinatronobacter thiooxidans]
MISNSLSARFLWLVVIFVMLAEVLIFVPSVSRYREEYLLARLERAQIASLALLASDGSIAGELAGELLENAGVYNVVLRRDAVRELILSSPIPGQIDATYDLRGANAFALMRDALDEMRRNEGRIIRVIGDPVRQAGLLIEITLDTENLQAGLWEYGKRILLLTLLISGITALLLYLSIQAFVVAPMRRVIRSMSAYAEAPQDANRIIVPRSTIREIREAEEALNQMQTDLTGLLRQKNRLVQLGGSVARISHDLRNMLTTASMLADRMELSKDPSVQRAAPKLVGSLSRAINLCESTLAFGKAEEAPPKLARLPLGALVEDVVENEKLAVADSAEITFLTDLPADLHVHADGEQLFRVLSNLVRNARQALEATKQPGVIEILAKRAQQDGKPGVAIRVGDSGPGLPPKAREHLFEAFQGGARKGGVGLGLAIAAELVRGHGGVLELIRSDAEGTEFRIWLPCEV